MKQNTENNKEKFTGAEIFVKCLEAEGIDLVFGYPGVRFYIFTMSFTSKTM